MKFFWKQGLLFLMFIMLSACGKMGSLYLPDDDLDSSADSPQTTQQKKTESEE